MQALTVRIPHALLIARGEKKIETRGWYTPVRGWLAIHAASTMTPDEVMLARSAHFARALGDDAERLAEYLGAVVAVAELTGIVRLDSLEGTLLFADLSGQEKSFGIYNQGERFLWQLPTVRRLPEPVTVRGHQMLWALPAQVERAIRAQVPDLPEG